jgi:NAD(P)-dependent dehydrogenase (short-subunit alcohol dehydrogenase family)
MIPGEMPWTASDALRQDGRTALVTGASSGLGLQTALGLARAGAHVLLGVRDAQRGDAAAARIAAAVPSARSSLLELDLADLGSVRAAAESMGARGEPLDILVLNAGVMATPHRTTADGFELQFGTNHLGHFALGAQLVPALLSATAPRVVTVSSGYHRMGRIDFDDLQAERRYRRWRAYAQSKLANLLFAFELQRRAAAADLPLRSVAAHPGWAATNLQTAGARMTGDRARELVMRLLNRIVAQSDEMGALPILYAATEDIPGGSYVGPSERGELRGPPTLVHPSRAATDEATAARLWAVSEELTGVRFELTRPTS